MHKILQITVDLLNSDRRSLLGPKMDFSLKRIITGVLLNVIFIYCLNLNDKRTNIMITYVYKMFLRTKDNLQKNTFCALFNKR